MARRSNYSTSTVSQRIPNYAVAQVNHFCRLLDIGGEIQNTVELPGPDGTLRPVQVIYSRTGLSMIDRVEASLLPPREVEQATDTAASSNPMVAAMTTPQLVAPLTFDQQTLMQFADRLFESWQRLANQVWGEPVTLERMQNQHFAELANSMFLAQIGAVAESGFQIQQGKLILTNRTWDGPLTQVGRQMANALTFTKILKRTKSQPIEPLRLCQLTTTGQTTSAPLAPPAIAKSTQPTQPIGIARLQRLIHAAASSRSIG